MVTGIIIAGVIVIVIIRLQGNFVQGYAYAIRSAAPLRSRIIPLSDRYREILTKYFSYYNQLSPRRKIKFEQKLCFVIYSKQFIPRDFEKVTDEMKVLISASAVQLTFGLPGVYLSHFSKILIYSTDYYSSITKRYHKGEVNPAFGVIVLSWKSFVMGYLQPDDQASNLGLHEMAHALRLENIIRNEEYHFFDEELIEQFDEFGKRVCDEEDHSDLRFFRPYACTNNQEFFAVAIENFFTRPVEFERELPQLYSILTKLLNQNPTWPLAAPSKNQAA